MVYNLFYHDDIHLLHVWVEIYVPLSLNFPNVHGTNVDNPSSKSVAWNNVRENIQVVLLRKRQMTYFY